MELHGGTCWLSIEARQKTHLPFSRNLIAYADSPDKASTLVEAMQSMHSLTKIRIPVEREGVHLMKKTKTQKPGKAARQHEPRKYVHELLSRYTLNELLPPSYAPNDRTNSEDKN